MGIFKRGKGEGNIDIGEIERRGGDGLKPKSLLSHAPLHSSHTSMKHNSHLARSHAIISRHSIIRYVKDGMTWMHACKRRTQGDT